MDPINLQSTQKRRFSKLTLHGWVAWCHLWVNTDGNARCSPVPECNPWITVEVRWQAENERLYSGSPWTKSKSVISLQSNGLFRTLGLALLDYCSRTRNCVYPQNTSNIMVIRHSMESRQLSRLSSVLQSSIAKTHDWWERMLDSNPRSQN